VTARLRKKLGFCRARRRHVGLIAGLVIGAAVVPISPVAAVELPAPAGGPAYEAMVLDAETGQVLRALNPDVVTYPASLTKMMTLYLTFEALNSGRLRLDQYLQVSAEAAAHRPSKLGLNPGEPVIVRDLILGVVTRSANDAAAVLAEGLGGSETNFAAMMTQKARQLGMSRTFYRNASGLPDPEQLTTARDIARLALALYHHFPREYRYFSVREFEFRGEMIGSHDHLLEWYEGADGIKTGYTVASGFNLATSAVRNGHRLIGVIMGGQSARIRDEEMARLLDVGFDDIARAAPAAAPSTMVAAATPAPQPPSPPQPQPQYRQPAMASASAPQPEPQPQSQRQQIASAAVSQPEPQPQIQRQQIASAAVSQPEPQPKPQPRAAVAAADQPPPTHERTLTAMAGAAIRHLAPVSRAEAAEAVPAGAAWSIQLGTFRGETAAEEAARKVARLALAKGKPPQILPPSPAEHQPLYRARLLHFSPREAQAACEALHKKGMACSVVKPGNTRVASR
jgi:D-alanyl-D-alanine carboxypeptidase